MTGDDKVLFDEIIKIPQFGGIGRIYTQKNKLTYSLDLVTGELKKLGVSSTALTTAQIAAVGTTTSELITAIKGDSDDAKLEQEVKLLENEKKKRDLSFL